MTILNFIRLLICHWKPLIVVPLVIATTVFLLTSGKSNTYKASTTVYTGFASGYNIESGENLRVDYNAVNTSFDNLINLIKARETKQEVALRLLAKNLLVQESDEKNILQESIEHIKEIIPDTLRRQVTVSGSIEGTYIHLCELLSETGNNVIYNIINDDDEPHYGIPAINEIKVIRLENSDIIRLEYQSDDPAICQATLSVITDVFIRKYVNLKKGETNTVVAYFEGKTKESLKRLHDAEEHLKKFRTKNKVINYYEQTKFISEKREEISDELSKERMKAASAKAALINIEDKLGNRKQLLHQNEVVLKKRNRLTQITGQLALSETLLYSQYNLVEITRLKNEVYALNNDLKSEIDKLYVYSRTKEGIALKDLLHIWLENTIALDESMARLETYQARKEEIEQTYEFFAPLGSSINQMERKIDVTEKEYLTMLASLSASHMREQNLKVSSQLKVVDPPYYPIEPESSKSTLLVIASGLIGFLLVIGLLIATELLDQSIRTPERAAKQTGLVVCGGLPVIAETTNQEEQELVERLVRQIVSRIELAARDHKGIAPFVVAIASTRSSEGKTMLGQKLLKCLNDKGKKVLHVIPVIPDQKLRAGEPSADTAFYQLGHDFSLIRNLQAFVPASVKLTDFDAILLELPALLLHTAPIGIGDIADMTFIITRSNRVWSDADQRALDIFSEVSSHKPEIILNGTGWYVLESFIGELPSSRSRFRAMVKRWAVMNFRGNLKSIRVG